MKILLLASFFLLTPAQAEEEKMSFTQIRQEQREFFELNKDFMIGTLNFDDLELDLLYQDLNTLSILELSRKYPELHPRQLEILKTNRK